MSFIRRIPIPMSALALGVAGLGNLLLPYSPLVRAVCGIVAATIVLLVLARIVFDFAGVRAELGNPGVLAVFPTLFMALMLLAAYLKPYAPTFATGMWAVALTLQLIIAVVCAVRFLRSFALPRVLPAWFLVFVGFVVASVTSPAFDALPVGRTLLYVGLVGYLGILPVVIYRMAKVGGLPEPALPTMAIFAAPPSLCLAGYLAVTSAKQPAVVYALLAMAAASLVYVFVHLPRILKSPFHPSYSALTFPFVISGIALKQANLFLAKTATGSFIPKAAVLTMDVFVTLMVLYVLVRYALFVAFPAEKRAATPAPAGA